MYRNNSDEVKYVPMAVASQTSGEVKLGHVQRSLG